MRVSLPLAADAALRRIFAAIEAAFEKINPYAVVPPGGAAGSVLTKTDARNFNTQWSGAPTTGAQTASFVATNKPGAANGAPAFWIPIVVGGTTYYIPAFS